MSARFAVFETEYDAISFIAQIDAALGLPDDGGTHTYSDARIGADDKFYVWIDERCPEALLEGVTIKLPQEVEWPVTD